MGTGGRGGKDCWTRKRKGKFLKEMLFHLYPGEEARWPPDCLSHQVLRYWPGKTNLYNFNASYWWTWLWFHKKGWFSGGGRDGWTDWFRQVHLYCHDGEWEPSRTKFSSWHHFWHFQQENKEQVPDQADPIQVIVEADVDSAQVAYTYTCFLFHTHIQCIL